MIIVMRLSLQAVHSTPFYAERGPQRAATNDRSVVPFSPEGLDALQF